MSQPLFITDSNDQFTDFKESVNCFWDLLSEQDVFTGDINKQHIFYQSVEANVSESQLGLLINFP